MTATKKNLKALLCAVLFGLTLMISGCSKTEKTLAGVGVGAVTGGLIGGAVGNTGGAVVGAGVGGAVGGIVGSNVD